MPCCMISRRHADHVRVADLPALDGGDDRHARAELALLRLHAQDAGVGVLERVEDLRGGAALSGRGATCSISTPSAGRADCLERGGEAGRDLARWPRRRSSATRSPGWMARQTSTALRAPGRELR